MTSVTTKRQPWWNHTVVYVCMVLVVAAVEVVSRTSPRGRSPSPLAQEQQLLEQLDARLNPVTIVAAAVQRPFLACLAVLALLLGLHVRVGMEDTLWPYPHRDDIINRNVEHFQQMRQIAALLGRELMTPAEYRQAIGLPAKSTFAVEQAHG